VNRRLVRAVEHEVVESITHVGRPLLDEVEQPVDPRIPVHDVRVQVLLELGVRVHLVGVRVDVGADEIGQLVDARLHGGGVETLVEHPLQVAEVVVAVIVVRPQILHQRSFLLLTGRRSDRLGQPERIHRQRVVPV